MHSALGDTEPLPVFPWLQREHAKCGVLPFSDPTQTRLLRPKMKGRSGARLLYLLHCIRAYRMLSHGSTDLFRGHPHLHQHLLHYPMEKAKGPVGH